MVAWFIDHPYLTIENLDNVEIGGAPGTRFDAVVYPVPDECIPGFRRPFVPLFPASPREGPFGLMEGNKNRIIILNVQNETVTIIIESPLDEFEGFLVRAEEILGTVKWDL